MGEAGLAGDEQKGRNDKDPPEGASHSNSNRSQPFVDTDSFFEKILKGLPRIVRPQAGWSGRLLLPRNPQFI